MLPINNIEDYNNDTESASASRFAEGLSASIFEDMKKSTEGKSLAELAAGAGGIGDSKHESDRESKMAEGISKIGETLKNGAMGPAKDLERDETDPDSTWLSDLKHWPGLSEAQEKQRRVEDASTPKAPALPLLPDITIIDEGSSKVSPRPSTNTPV